MRSLFLSVFGLGAAAGLAAVGIAASASASSAGFAAVHEGAVAAHVSPAKRGNCYSNMKQDSGTAVLSQTFEDSGLSTDNSYAADNFAVKKTCKITGVVVVGKYFNGAGPADSETVTFFADKGGAPGQVINSQTVTGTDDDGSFTIPLSTVAIPPGAAWVSVSANMYYAQGGEWGWELTNHIKQGHPAMWENPGGGLGVGCTTWTPLETCLGYPGDFMFTLTK